MLLIYEQSKQCPVVLNQAETLPGMPGNTVQFVYTITSTVPVLLIYEQSKQCPVVLNQAETLPRMPGDTVQFVYTIHKYSPEQVQQNGYLYAVSVPSYVDYGSWYKLAVFL